MANYTAADIKALREQTGAGMMDVKKALDEADGDHAQGRRDPARQGPQGRHQARGPLDLQRPRGAPRPSDGVGTLVEVNCETDFVAKGEKFIALAEQVLAQAVAAEATDADALLASTLEDGKTVQELLDEANATIGEKIEVRRVARVEGDERRRRTSTRRAPTCRRRSVSSSRSRVATSRSAATSRCTSPRSARPS